MRNIAAILEDDKNGKQLSHTERQIAVAYMQGKYDAVRELKIGNSSNTNEVLDKMRAEIKALSPEPTAYDVVDGNPVKDAVWEILIEVDKIIDKYKAEIEPQSEVSMALEEAIKTYTSNAEYERTHGNLQGCLEFRQLAKWLEELRVYRNMYHVDNCLREEVTDNRNDD